MTKTAEWREILDPDAPRREVGPQRGDELGSYVLSAHLGTGGMGTVFRARHTQLGRDVAIKVLNPEFAQRRDVLHRFFREAHAVNLIHHPNIVDIYDIIEPAESPPYIVMELLDGQSLTQYIAKEAPLASTTASRLIRQICSAMSAVHAAGIVHRDLKPTTSS